MQRPSRHLLALTLATDLVGAGFFAAPRQANAVDIDTSYSQKVEECTTAYHEAQERLDELNAQIEENTEHIKQLESDLPAQRERAAASVRTLYKYHQGSNGLLDLVLSADDFNQFLATVRYLDIIQTYNYDELDRLVQMEDELSIARVTLEDQVAEAQEEVDKASQALAEAEEAREAARQAALAQSLAEQQAAQQALKEAREHEGETFETASGGKADVQVPDEDDSATDDNSDTNGDSNDSSESQDDADSQDSQDNQDDSDTQDDSESQDDSSAAVSSRDRFVQVWSARIDAYNAGYPLGGYGYAFAEAAYDSGLDPRFAAAIARVESSSGLYCFASHNAWGWGSSSWNDWDTAIRSYSRGLAAGYGYTLSYEGAQAYCPPGGLWYSAVAAQLAAVWPTDTI